MAAKKKAEKFKTTKRFTASRAFGFSSDIVKTGVFWVGNTYQAGVYEVWLNGEMYAVVTDKWMGQLIMEQVLR